MHASLVLCVVCWMASLTIVRGHGRLIDPPSRSSMWRFGFNNTPNYNDNELFCGGFAKQVELGGKCGVCGDPFDGERKNEAGGIYANGIITRQYAQAQTITVKVDITANHKGYFEIRLCPHNNPSVPVTQDCLDEHLLQQPDGSERYNLTSDKRGEYSFQVALPDDVTCAQCVLQWKYHTGNSWGCGADGDCCVGCGMQEEFYGCSDVAILDSDDQQTTQQSNQTKPESTTITQTTSPVKETTTPVKQTTTSVKQTTTSVKQTTTPVTQTTTSATTRKTTTTTTTRTPTTTTRTPSTITPLPSTNDCRAVGLWKGSLFITDWCLINCPLGYCPSDLCSPACRNVQRRRR